MDIPIISQKLNNTRILTSNNFIAILLINSNDIASTHGECKLNETEYENVWTNILVLNYTTFILFTSSGLPQEACIGARSKISCKNDKTYLDGSGSTDRPAPSFFPVLSWRFVNLDKNLLHLNITLKLALAKKWCLKYKNREFAYVSFTTINDVKTANKRMSAMLQNYIDIQFLPFEFAVILKYEIINLLLWWMRHVPYRKVFMCYYYISRQCIIFFLVC